MVREDMALATQAREDVGGDALDLVAFVPGIADRVDDHVGAPGGLEGGQRLRALLRRADDPVLARQRLEVLRVALCQVPDPRRLGRLPVAADGDEPEMAERKAVQPPAGRRGGGPDLVDALGVALWLHDVGHPAVTLAARAGERRVRAPADPDRRPRLLHGPGIDRHALELREAALEAGGGVPPQKPPD